MSQDGIFNQTHQSLPRLELSDIATTLDEGITGWLDRHALEREPPKPDAAATGTLVLATRVVGEVSSVCESWRLSTRVIPHSQPGWSVTQVSGPLSPVLALGEVITALRAFVAR
jgi:hypothetical protein